MLRSPYSGDVSLSAALQLDILTPIVLAFGQLLVQYSVHGDVVCVGMARGNEMADLDPTRGTDMRAVSTATDESKAAKVAKTAAGIGAGVGIALVLVIVRRMIVLVLLIAGISIGALLGGGFWFLVCPVALLIGYRVALRYVRLP